MLKMERESINSLCTVQPGIFFLVVTLIVTATATAMLCSSIVTENWVYVTWNREKLIEFEKEVAVNTSSGANIYNLEWLLDGQVARVVLDLKESEENLTKEISENEENEENLAALFFVPIQGGIWKFCVNITGEQHQHLNGFGFPNILCKNYLKLDSTRKGLKANRQHRMQNLSISCALVCLIILGSSALIGLFGITKHQISAVLITGVMYLLAAPLLNIVPKTKKTIFAIFSLTIINFKRAQEKVDCFNESTTNELIPEGVVVSKIGLEKPYSLKEVNKYFDARIFTAGWSLHLGWGGTGMCLLVSILWILLSKIMRYNPFNTFSSSVIALIF